MEIGEQMAKTKHLGMLAVAAGMLAAVGMLVLMTLVVKAKPARALAAPAPFHYALVYDYCLDNVNIGLWNCAPTRETFIADFTKSCTTSPTGICGGTGHYFLPKRAAGETAAAQNAAWSPDGSKIAFECKPSPVDAFGNDYEICTINGNMYNISSFPDYQQQLTKLTDNTWNDGDPTWSPDGSRIAFTSTRDGNYEIYTMRSDGTGFPTRLTNNPDPDTSPDWSPTGTKIAFTSLRFPPLEGASGFDIYTMNTDGTGLKQLTSRPKPQCRCQLNDWPSWSPDGTKIAFSSDRSGIETNNFEIYTMNSADGSGLERLTFNQNLDIEPTWSPDGRKIVFVSNREFIMTGKRTTRLYWTLSNGAVTTRLFATYPARAPDWHPNPLNY
jgi:Tol biopolymer transport system component